MIYAIPDKPSNPLKVLRNPAPSYRYPHLTATVMMHPTGRLNGYSLCSMFREMNDVERRILDRSSSFDVVAPSGQYGNDRSSETILAYLLKEAGMPGTSAALAANIFPDPHVFHPHRSPKQAHKLADMLLSRSAVTDPIEALLYTAAQAKSVTYGQRQYVAKLEHAEPRLLRFRPASTDTREGAD